MKFWSRICGFGSEINIKDPLNCNIFWQGRVSATHCLCRPYMIFEGCLDSNPHSLPWKTGAPPTRDTREGWPLLSADCWKWGEWRLKEYKWKGSFLGLVSLGSSCQYKRLLSCLGCSGQPSAKHFFLTVHYRISSYVSPSLSNLVRQSCRAACLWMCVSATHLIHLKTHTLTFSSWIA